MWIVAAVLAALGLGGIAAYEYKKKHPTGGLPASSLPVTQTLVAGKNYALNVFTVPDMNPTLLLSLLGPGFAVTARAPAKVKANVVGTGYTFAPLIDQWIVWVTAKANGNCPIMFAGTTPGSVGGVVLNAVDLTAMLPSASGDPEIWGYHGQFAGEIPRGQKWGSFGGKFGVEIPRGQKWGAFGSDEPPRGQK